MKAQELRIGNLVFIENDLLPETKGKIYKVYGVSEKYNFDFPESTGTVSLNQIGTIRNYSQFDEFIKPISLTKELLLRLGFDVNNSPEWIDQLKKYEIICGTTSYLRGAENSVYPIKYVHQLQNLYFDLTGEEITI